MEFLHELHRDPASHAISSDGGVQSMLSSKYGSVRSFDPRGGSISCNRCLASKPNRL